MPLVCHPIPVHIDVNATGEQRRGGCKASGDAVVEVKTQRADFPEARACRDEGIEGLEDEDLEVECILAVELNLAYFADRLTVKQHYRAFAHRIEFARREVIARALVARQDDRHLFQPAKGVRARAALSWRIADCHA